MSLNQSANVALASCPHCGSEVPDGCREAPFCCAGCREVHALLREEGLAHYYDLARGDGVPAAKLPADRSFAWLEPLLATAEQQAGPVISLDLDVQGIHCAACVWLMNELFRRKKGGAAITVNPALGKIHLSWQRGIFDLVGYLKEIEKFGYQFGPSRKKADPMSRDLPMRIGICAAIAMNVMMFAVAFYMGLAPSDGQLFVLFTKLSLYLSTVAVIVGGYPFFKAAWQGIRRGVLHLDLPISAGILLAYGTSLLKSRDGRGDLAYFDTLDVFVTLMLVGRWLQQRVLERNRRFLLEDGGVEGIHVRRQEGSQLVVQHVSEVRADDRLVIAPGDLIPIDAELLDANGQVSTDWINGESKPRQIQKGASIPAGAFNAGNMAIHVRAISSFEHSPLPMLLQAGAHNGPKPMHARLTELVSRIYVPVVLSFAALGLWIWWPKGPATALDVTTALLIVTCPCSIGISLPLAGELALARLRRAGVFVRSGDLLDRALRLRKILFDKTGTLTLGRLELVERGTLRQLTAGDRDVLYAMTARSNHPVSKCLASELSSVGAIYSAEAEVTEVPGQGLELNANGHRYRLGRASWAVNDASEEKRSATAFSVDGREIASFILREKMRRDACDEVSQLRARGLDVWLISGDSAERVTETAKALGIPADHALAGQRPEDKAEAVKRLDQQDALFIGDGVNDSLAFESAFMSGTPAVDRPVMPGKADFFLAGDGIRGVRELLDTAQTLRRTMRRTLIWAQIYNVVTITLSLAGLMTPLRAAIAMPLSTVAVISIAVASFSQSQKSRRSAKRTTDPLLPTQRAAA
jgi:Cu2+-exporting ATPase